jgi:hypothetical protein
VAAVVPFYKNAPGQAEHGTFDYQGSISNNQQTKYLLFYPKLLLNRQMAGLCILYKYLQTLAYLLLPV